MVQILIYGAYGYTGHLITQEAIKNSLPIIVAGRDMHKVITMGEEFDIDYRFFDLDFDELQYQFKDVDIVLNCAGPFSSTAEIIAKACMNTSTHYLDITGEIKVFESLQQYHHEAQEKAVMLMPGVGFDVVATDCLAKYLHTRMPDAVKLELAFYGFGNVSEGTTRSQVERVKYGGAIREDGELKVVPMLSKSKELTFLRDDGTDVQRTSYLIPWGDLSTAYWTTGIPNIEVYQPFSKSMARLAKITRYLRWLFHMTWIENLMKKMQLRMNPAPKIGDTSGTRMYVRGSVWDDAGRVINARVSTSSGYHFTAESAVTILQNVVNGEFHVGYQTPAGCYDADLLQQIPNTTDFEEFE